jgi:hypothetical protein
LGSEVPRVKVQNFILVFHYTLHPRRIKTTKP